MLMLLAPDHTETPGTDICSFIIALPQLSAHHHFPPPSLPSTIFSLPSTHAHLVLPRPSGLGTCLSLPGMLSSLSYFSSIIIIATFLRVSSISLHFQKPSLMSLASKGALQFSAPTSGRHLSTCLEPFCFHLFPEQVTCSWIAPAA